jgi:uncharacterized protein with HEPN domain
MPSKSDVGFLSDIARNIELAREFVGSRSFAEFQADQKSVYALTRCLEIISEASRRLSSDIKTRHPEINWTDMAGAGNVYRHGYQVIREDILWRTVHDFLPPLLAVIEQELAALRDG